MLTDEQKKAVKDLYNNPNYGPTAISAIACKLGLTREYVQDYIKRLNKGLEE